ncbi:MAG: dihydrolipoamide acetyltransferase family protein [Anaerolineae bacterium]
MPTQVIMPQLGESVVEGTVTKWLLAPGQPVKEYEPLLVVATDKVETEIPAPASGVLLAIHVSEGATVPAGTVLAEIGEAAGARDQESGARSQGPGDDLQPALRDPTSLRSGDYSSQPSATPLAQRMAAEHGIALAEVPGTGLGGRVTKEDVEAFLAATGQAPEPSAGTEPGRREVGFISPAVGRLAAELGVDLSQVVGTGAGGRITKKDVLAYVAAPSPRPAAPAGPAELPPWERPGTGDLFKPAEEMGPAAPTPSVPSLPSGPLAPAPSAPTDSELVPLSTVRRAIAQHMMLSKHTSPHVTTVMEADLTRVLQAREKLRGEFEHQGVKLTLTPFFVQAVVAGLRAVPEANSTFTEDGLLLHKRIHIGMAVAIPDGLIVPVIRDADEKSLLGLARAVSDLAERARAKKLRPDEVQGGTFTLTNHGTAGSLFATPIINQPQAGILGVGAVQKRVVVLSKGDSLLPGPDDTIAIRPMVYLSFTFDHRILDGQAADGFLLAVKRFLEGYAG